MSDYQKKYLIVVSALVLLCLSSAYCIHIYVEAAAKAKNAKYFSDLDVVEAAGDAMKMYVDHHKGQLPDSRNWEESIAPYRHDKDNTVALKEHLGNRLAMNSSLSNVNVYHHNYASDGPIVLYEVHSDTKDASGIPPWKQCYQCGESTKGRLMIAFASGWAYSYANGPEITSRPLTKK